MNLVCTLYRKGCRELTSEECGLLNKLLREMTTNSVQRKLCWNIKSDFLTLWFISAGRFPELATSPIADWMARQLPFELNEQELQLLKL